MTSLLDLTAAIKRRFDDNCFACGTDNPLGLGIEINAVEGGSVFGSFTPRQDHRGIQGQLHGGLSATALDEIMVWAGLLTNDTLSVTGTMSLRYKRAVPNDGSPLHLTARVDKRRGSRLEISGSLSRDNIALVTASGLYIATSSLEDLL